MNLCGKAARLVRVCRNAAANCFGQPVVVLTYHRVAVLRDDPEQLAVSPDRFRRQLEFLRSNYPILRFDEPWGKPERMSFVITFDDGYADNLTAALPILREFDCPAAFFICAGAIGSEREFPWDGGGTPQRKEFRTLRPDELRELAADPLAAIGSHTVSHPRLSGLSPEEQRREIAGGHRMLEELIGRRLTVFSYPFGNYRDFNADSVAVCRECGFFRAAANYPGQYHPGSDPLTVPRHLVRDWDADEFQSRMFRFKYL